MRTKAIPAPPESLAAIEPLLDALPRVPRPGEDCCRRLQRRVAWIDDRDAAETWLAFLRALDCVASADGALARRTTSVSPGQTAQRFESEVFLAREVRAALGDRPRPPEAVFEAVADEVPPWERRRSADWQAVWRERVAHLLEWWVLFGGARHTDDGFVRTPIEDAATE